VRDLSMLGEVGCGNELNFGRAGSISSSKLMDDKQVLSSRRKKLAL
jgi:hypothetical protein